MTFGKTFRRITGTIGLAGALLLPGTLSAQHHDEHEEESPITAEAGVLSKYERRGMELSETDLMSAAVRGNYGIFSAGLSGLFNSEEVNEFRFEASLGTETGPTEWKVWYASSPVTNFDVEDFDLNDFNEAGAKIEFDVPLRPSFTYLHDFNNGTYWKANVEQEVEFKGIEAGAELAFRKHYDGRIGLRPIEIHAEAPVMLGNVKLVPSFGFEQRLFQEFDPELSFGVNAYVPLRN